MRIPDLRSPRIGIAVLALALALAAAVPLACQAPAPDRYLDGPADRDGSVRLVVFNPETFNIRCLVALRKNGAIDIPGLTVVGVYHERQRDDFADSRRYVEENGLDWFKFHVVSAEISEPVLFKKNGCAPEFERIVEKADGVIFFGGPDIPPSVFGEKTLLLTEISDPYRHLFEVSAVFHLLGGSQDETFAPLLDKRPGFPVMGICLGHQTLNVGTGGTLVQDVWTEAYGKTTVEEAIALGPEQWHTNPYRRLFPLDNLMGVNYHTLQLGDNSLFVKAMGFKSADHPRIRSSHHQAVEKLGKGLVAVASSRDGRVVEAVEHKKYPNVLGVQFHPEHYLHFDAEPRFRQKPGDAPTSLLAVLEGTPPSAEFNKKIWSWFAGKLVESHGR
jgi:putative glutamine amidotransferase